MSMLELFKDRLKAWRGKRYQKEAANDLGIPLPTYRKYENGKRTPVKLSMCELERRMKNHES
jgi:transcriptional regulator with XRE-family HTH domain